MKTRKNQFDVEWQYAKACWAALVAGQPLPPVAHYSVWEVEENSGKERLIKTVPCRPMNMRYNEGGRP